jgi:hypothetical protein
MNKFQKEFIEESKKELYKLSNKKNHLESKYEYYYSELKVTNERIKELKDIVDRKLRVCLDCESIDSDADTSNVIFEYCDFHRAERSPYNY